MKKILLVTVVLSLFIWLAPGCGEYDGPEIADNPSEAVDSQTLAAANGQATHDKHISVCARGGQGEARCHARVTVDEKGSPKAAPAAPTGYGPAQLRGAYGLSGLATGNPIIAIVDAYNHANILADLNTYSAYYGIPTMQNCPTSPWPPVAPCFRKVDQNGGTKYPANNAGWALEIALDVEVAHAICQNCTILLVEAKSAQFADLMAAVNRARLMGAKVISNSYGASEFSGETAYDSNFNYPGVAFTVSSGDSGYGNEYPASSQFVTAVGGTTLTLSGTLRVSETVWSGAGSGCSAYEPQPAFQTALGLTGCAKRMVADVAAVADPNTGASVYDSISYQGKKGWFRVGGTSLSAPLVAGVYALGGVPAGVQANSLPYSMGNYVSNLFDITSGTNGSCGGSYLCTAAIGYDGPTGRGTPQGSGAF